jgi:hypothetical protein
MITFQAEQERLSALRKAEDERLRLMRENDEGRKALQKMMDGTLKTRRDLSALEITLERESWMDTVAEEDMTDAQLQALAEYQVKHKNLLEEQEKYRRQLDNELRKLKTEIGDLLSSFDSKLTALREMRNKNDVRIFCQELVSIRLGLSEHQAQEDEALIDILSEEYHVVKDLCGEAEKNVTRVEREVSIGSSRLDDLIRHERALTSEFKSILTNTSSSIIEPEAMTQLTRLFKHKPVMVKKRPEDVKDVGQTEEFVWDYPVLTYPGDCPEGVEEAVWKKMMELRRARYLTDTEIQKSQFHLRQLEVKNKFYSELLLKCQSLCANISEKLTAHASFVWLENPDLEVMLKLRQGQVNVPQAAVVTDYSDAMVINTEVIESRNRHILQLAKEKIGVLNHIKDFRKKISLVEWEHKMIDLQARDLNERTKDVQMLRMTKELQTLLKTGEEGTKEKNEVEMLEKMMEHLAKSSKKKKEDILKLCRQVDTQIAAKHSENSMLEAKVAELEEKAAQRGHMSTLRSPHSDSDEDTSGRLRTRKGEKKPVIGGGGKIKTNESDILAASIQFRESKQSRILLETAKKHTVEIEHLRRELDALRQRTFPSFIRTGQHRASNPDQKTS